MFGTQDTMSPFLFQMTKYVFIPYETDNSGKTEKWKLAAEKNFPTPSTKSCVIYKLGNNLKLLKKLKPGKEAPPENLVFYTKPRSQ